jgi:carboxylesterase type B
LNSWRYRYAGEWDNQYIGEGAGAYHGSEIALVFGTTPLLSKKPDVEEEIKLSKAMRTAWTSFAKDPENGLTKLGWPVYDQSKPTLVKLGGRFSGDITFVNNTVYDNDCARLRAGTARKFQQSGPRHERVGERVA